MVETAGDGSDPAAGSGVGMAVGILGATTVVVPNPGGGFVKVAAGAAMPEGGQPGMLGALMLGGSRAEIPFRTETIWLICCC